MLSWLRSCAAADDRVTVLEVAPRAVSQAWRMDDPRRAATAAVAAVDGALWVPRQYVVDDAMVDTLRRTLHALSADDEQLRCRVMLVLAAELYYAETPRERAALVDEGLAMARRLDDPALVAWACLMFPNALCSPGNAADRHAVADEAVTAARRVGSRTMLADALVHRAGAALELGRVADFLADEAAARRIAEGLELAYPLVALDMMLIPWRAMQGRFDDAEALSRQLLTLLQRTRIHPGQGIEIGAVLPLLKWRGKAAEALDLVLGHDHWFFHLGRRLLLGQAGRLDELRASWERFGTADPADDWIAMYSLCEAASTASLLGLRPVGAQVYRRLAPYAGTVASAGASGTLGPVDTYLALAASAAGETGIATRHADDALALCADWGLPVCAEAIRALRRAGGF